MASFRRYNEYDNIEIKDVLICNSGLVIRLIDIQELSVRPFDEESQVVDVLKGVQYGNKIFIKTTNNGNQEMDFDNAFNLKYHVGDVNVNHEAIFKAVIKGWLKSKGDYQ